MSLNLVVIRLPAWIVGVIGRRALCVLGFQVKLSGFELACRKKETLNGPGHGTETLSRWPMFDKSHKVAPTTTSSIDMDRSRKIRWSIECSRWTTQKTRLILLLALGYLLFHRSSSSFLKVCRFAAPNWCFRVESIGSNCSYSNDVVFVGEPVKLPASSRQNLDRYSRKEKENYSRTREILKSSLESKEKIRCPKRYLVFFFLLQQRGEHPKSIKEKRK